MTTPTMTTGPLTTEERNVLRACADTLYQFHTIPGAGTLAETLTLAADHATSDHATNALSQFGPVRAAVHLHADPGFWYDRYGDDLSTDTIDQVLADARTAAELLATSHAILTTIAARTPAHAA